MGLNITIVGTSDRQLEELLRGQDMRVKSLPVGDLLALAQQATAQPDVVVLDLRDSNALPPTLSTLRRQHPTTGVVIVAARLDPVLMLEAMRAGVTEWVTNPVTSADFVAALERVTVTRSAAVQGQLFAFVGAKGGVGTTTLAVNVAAALARLTGERTLFIDLHMSYGDAAVFFGAEPRFSVVDAIENTHRLDEAFFDSLVVSTKSRVHLLASADRATHGADLDAWARCSILPARTIATRSWTCPGRKLPRSTPWNRCRRSSSSRTRNWRRCATPAAWPPLFDSGTARTASAWCSRATTSRRRSARKTWSGSSGWP